MIKIEAAIKKQDGLRGVIYLQDPQTGKYENEIGEADIFNQEGDVYAVYLYLADQYKEDIQVEAGIVRDKLLLGEKLKKFIGEQVFATGPITLEMNVSFLSASPALDYIG